MHSWYHVTYFFADGSDKSWQVGGKYSRARIKPDYVNCCINNVTIKPDVVTHYVANSVSGFLFLPMKLLMSINVVDFVRTQKICFVSLVYY